jgi:glycosyltransferase involved in cell wall biosynthesis
MTQRIAFVAWGFEPFGGMERHITELALALRSRGHEVQVFLETPAPATNSYVARLQRHGVSVSGAGVLAGFLDRLGRLNLGGARQAITAPIRSRHAHPVTRDLFRRLAAAFADRAPDVIHVHGTRLRQAWVIDWAHARGIPTVYTEHVTLDERGGAVDAAAVATMRTRLGAMLCVSERSRASLRAVLGDAVSVGVMRHVVQAPPEATNGARAKPIHSTSASHSGALRAVCVARLEHYKGIDVLLRALALVQAEGVRVTMRIAGDGAEREALESLARTLTLRDVHFIGAVAPERVGDELRDADLMVLPSRGEGLPLAIVEAMAHGLPVIATRVGGNEEAVDDGNTGLLVPPEQPEALAAAIIQLARDHEARRRMGDAARRAWASGGWSPDAVVADALQLYASAATGPRAR